MVKGASSLMRCAQATSVAAALLMVPAAGTAHAANLGGTGQVRTWATAQPLREPLTIR
jgi:hypothetical protein